MIPDGFRTSMDSDILNLFAIRDTRSHLKNMSPCPSLRVYDRWVVDDALAPLAYSG